MELLGSDVLEWKPAVETGRALINGKNPRFGMLIVCGVNFGLRIGDLLTVTWEDLRKDFFVLNEEKTGKKRKLLVNSTVKAALAELETRIPENRQKGPVFLSNKGTVYSQQQVNRLLKKIFGPGVSSHGLRKTFGRQIYEKSGNNLAKVQLQLNHGDPAHTLRYIGITQKDMDECFHLIEE